MIEHRAVGPAGDLTRLRQINEHAILDLVRTRGELRAAEVAKLSGLTRASVVEVLGSLERKGWVAVEAPVAAGRGRPAHRYRFRNEAGRVAGLDIGAHTVRAAIADLAGTVTATAHGSVTPELPRRLRVAAAAQVLQRCLDAGDTGADDVWVTAVGSTGRLDNDGRMLLASAIPDWAGIDLVEALTGRVPGIVTVENDVRLAAIAEQQVGVAHGIDDLILMQTGRRAGLGIILDGHLRRGYAGIAGDISPFSAVHCDHAFQHLDGCRATPASGPGDDHIADVFTAAEEGNRAALTAVRRYARAVANVTATAVSLIDPQLVVLGGVLAAHASLVLPVLTKELDTRCLRTPDVRPSAFSSDAVVRGAICQGLNHLGRTLLGTGDGMVAPLRSPRQDR